MGIVEKLTEIEELAARKCTVTFTSDGDLRNGAELCVENCRCVRELSENYVVLSVYGMDIRVVGAPLTLQSFGVGGVKLTGYISSLSFEEKIV